MSAWEVFETIGAGALTLFILLGAYAIDATAEWNRNRRTSRRGAVSASPTCPGAIASRPSTGGPVLISRALGGRGRGTRRPEPDSPPLSRWW